VIILLVVLIAAGWAVGYWFGSPYGHLVGGNVGGTLGVYVWWIVEVVQTLMEDIKKAKSEKSDKREAKP
jgi:hypothetical protein